MCLLEEKARCCDERQVMKPILISPRQHAVPNKHTSIERMQVASYERAQHPRWNGTMLMSFSGDTAPPSIPGKNMNLFRSATIRPHYKALKQYTLPRSKQKKV